MSPSSSRGSRGVVRSVPSEDAIGRGQNLRCFRTVSIGGKPVYLELAVPRVGCEACGAVRQVKIGFADPRVSYTRAFALNEVWEQEAAEALLADWIACAEASGIRVLRGGRRTTSRFGKHERQSPRHFGSAVRRKGASGLCLSSAPRFVVAPVIEATAADVDRQKRGYSAQLLQ